MKSINKNIHTTDCLILLLSLVIIDNNYNSGVSFITLLFLHNNDIISSYIRAKLSKYFLTFRVNEI